MAEKDAAQAVRAAYNYLLTVSPTANSFSNFRLEEIASDKEGNFNIILSYDASGEFSFERKREFKSFKVNKDFSVEWMKIHKI